MRRKARFVFWASLGSLVLLAGGCSFFDSPPNPDFTWSPLEPLARTEVRFTDQSTDTGGLFGGGGIVSRVWDFGDGTTSSAVNPSHRYRCEGSYEVTLTVTDTAGLSRSATKRVDVQPSLHGRWKGTIWDALNRSFDLEFELYHSSPGSVTGTAYVNGLACNIINISFDPLAKKVRITFAYWATGNTWLLVGDYVTYPGCDLIELSGYWENITVSPGRKMGDWEVRLQLVSFNEANAK